MAAALLGLAAIATAWSTYQANRWSGVMATESSLALRLSNDAGKQQQQGDAQYILDTSMFVAWATALLDEDADMFAAGYIEESLFSEELRTALEAWQEMPDGPESPFEIEAYALPQWERAEDLERRSAAAGDASRAANETSDDYVLLTVVLASVLFLGGIAGTIDSIKVRLIFLSVASVLLATVVIVMVTYPVH